MLTELGTLGVWTCCHQSEREREREREKCVCMQLSPSLSLTDEQGAYTLFIGQIEREKDREKVRER